MSTYASCNQPIKDFINGTVLVNAITPYWDADSTIITLDDVDNGTSCALQKAGYPGYYVVIQIDKKVALAQYQKWKEQYGVNRYTVGRYSVHANDVCDFQMLFPIWSAGRPVKLWNFDFVSLFSTLPIRVLRDFIENPSVIDKEGTIIAFTFQAIPHQGLLRNLKSKHHRRFAFLRSLSNESLVDYHLRKVDTLMQTAPACFQLHPMDLEKYSVDGATIKQNAIVYTGGASIMMFLIYRASHRCDTQHQYTGRTEPEGKKRKRRIVHDDESDLSSSSSDSDQDLHLLSRLPATNSVPSLVPISTEFHIPPSTIPLSPVVPERVSRPSPIIHRPVSPLPSTIIVDLVPPSSQPSSKTLHTFQKTAISLAERHNKGFFNIVCGAGKTLIIENILLNVTRCGILFEPSKILVDQVSTDYFRSSGVQIIKINSDHFDDSFTPSTIGDIVIIIANLQSLHNVDLYCRAHSLKPEIICYDEAHRFTSNAWLRILGGEDHLGGESANESFEESEDIEDLDEIEVNTVDYHNSLVKRAKNFFFTATPPPVMYRYPEVYGLELMNYTHKQAVDDGIIKSFDTVIEFYREEDAITDKLGYIQLIKSINRLIEEKDLKRILIYTSFVVTKEAPISTVEDMYSHQSHFAPDYTLYFISASTSWDVRDSIFKSFREEKDDVQIIISCKTISEGIDLVNCDCVVNLDPTKSIIQAVQRGTRPCRISPSERAVGHWKNAILFYPVNISQKEFLNMIDSEKQNDLLDSTVRLSQFEHAMRIINFMKNDFDLHVLWNLKHVDVVSESEEVEEIEREGGTGAASPKLKKLNAEIRISGLVDDVYKWNVEDFNSSMRYLSVKLVGRDCDELWMESYNSAYDYVTMFDYPRHKSSDAAAKKIARWLSAQKLKKEHNLLKDQQIVLLDSLPNWTWKKFVVLAKSTTENPVPNESSSDRRWRDNLQKVLIIGNFPNSKTEIELHRWCQNQRAAFKKKELSQWKIIELEKISWWAWSGPYNSTVSHAQCQDQPVNFTDRLPELIAFVDSKSRLPVESNVDRCERNLALWCQKRRKDYRSNKLSADQVANFENVPGWKWGRSLDEDWWKMFDLVEVYCNKYRKVPSAGSTNVEFKKLGAWCTSQRQAYAGKRISGRSLTKDKIEALEALPGWFWEGVCFRDVKKRKL